MDTAKKETVEGVKRWLRTYLNKGAQQDYTPLGEARERLINNMPTRCPCCRQHSHVYRRPLHYGMCRDLILCYRWYKENPPGSYLKIQTHLAEKYDIVSSDYGKFRYWGMLEKAAEPREDGSKKNGLYRLTENGELFINNKLKAADHLYIYNDKVIHDVEEYKYVTIEDVIRNKKTKRFNYQELMNGYHA